MGCMCNGLQCVEGVGVEGHYMYCTVWVAVCGWPCVGGCVWLVVYEVTNACI